MSFQKSVSAEPMPIRMAVSYEWVNPLPHGERDLMYYRNPEDTGIQPEESHEEYQKRFHSGAPKMACVKTDPYRLERVGEQDCIAYLAKFPLKDFLAEYPQTNVILWGSQSADLTSFLRQNREIVGDRLILVNDTSAWESLPKALKAEFNIISTNSLPRVTNRGIFGSIERQLADQQRVHTV